MNMTHLQNQPRQRRTNTSCYQYLFTCQLHTITYTIITSRHTDNHPAYQTMGARHSTGSTACQSTPPKAKDAGSTSAFEPGGTGDPPLVPKNAAAPIVPPKPMPQLQRPETFEEKLYRKVCRRDDRLRTEMISVGAR